MTDNQPDALRKSNRVNHVHHYVPKGSGLSCWAECDVTVGGLRVGEMHRCREKLAGDNGPIVGSRSTIERAIGEAA